MTAADYADSPGWRLSPRAKLEILFATLLALFLFALDQTVVGVALPRINGVTKHTLWDGNICWPHKFADWFGESVNEGSAIGGTVLNHHRVSDHRYRVAGDTTWYGPAWTFPANCKIENPKPPYYCRTVSNEAIDMWTATHEARSISAAPARDGRRVQIIRRSGDTSPWLC